MGMLGTAFLAGAGQGLQAAGHMMYRGVERQQEEDIATRRAKLLAQLQRENADLMRKDEFAFRNDPTNVQAEIGTATTKAEAAGKVARGEQVATLNDPELNAARDADALREATRKADAAAAALNNPNLTKAQLEAAARELDEAKKRIDALAPSEAKRAGMISAATVGAAERERAKHDTSRQTLSGKMAEIEGVIGRPLSQQEREGFVGLGKKDDGMSKWMRGLVDEDIKAGNITADKAPERLKQIESAFRALDQESAIGSAVQQARKDGKAAEAAEELRSKGFSDEQLVKWFTPAELKKAEATKGVAAWLQRGASPLGTMFDATASKIATDNFMSRIPPGR